jgi:hypothetical protein
MTQQIDGIPLKDQVWANQGWMIQQAGRFAQHGVCDGDFLISSSIAGAMNSQEKFAALLNHPAPVIIVVERWVNGESKRVEIDLPCGVYVKG